MLENFKSKSKEKLADAFEGADGSVFDIIKQSATFLKEAVEAYNENRQRKLYEKEARKRGEID